MLLNTEQLKSLQRSHKSVQTVEDITAKVI